MEREAALMWAAIAGLYVWQFWHGRSCMDWRTKVSATLGQIKGSLGIRE